MSATRTAERESTQIPRASYQDVLDAPAHRVAEIVDGTLYTHPRPAMPHARASSSPGVKIGGPFDYDAGGPISIRPFDAITSSLGDLWP